MDTDDIMNMEETGIVKFFSPRRGYGFIKRDAVPEGQENHEIFVHYTQIEMDGFKTLLPGLKVSFTVKMGKKEDSIEAIGVKVVPFDSAEKKKK